MNMRRADAIAELFATLEDLLVAYQTLPEGERLYRWAADADRITGAVARQLSSTRTRISAMVAADPTRSAEAGTI